MIDLGIAGALLSEFVPRLVFILGEKMQCVVAFAHNENVTRMDERGKIKTVDGSQTVVVSCGEEARGRGGLGLEFSKEISMAGKFGVKETKELFALGFALAKAGKDVMADGKVNFLDLGVVIELFPKVAPAIDGIEQVPSELGELDEAEEKELLAFAAEKLPTVVDNELLKKKVYVYLRAGLAVVAAIQVSRA